MPSLLQAYREEALGSSSIQALVGMACHAAQAGTCLAAAEKLCAALDGCGGADFLRCIGADCKPRGAASRRAAAPASGTGRVPVATEAAAAAAAHAVPKVESHPMTACLLGGVHETLCALLQLRSPLQPPASCADSSGAGVGGSGAASASGIGLHGLLQAEGPAAPRQAAYAAARQVTAVREGGGAEAAHQLCRCSSECTIC